MKFNRTYSLFCEVGPYSKPTTANGSTVPNNQVFQKYATQSVTIDLPFTVEFTIKRENLATAQTANFKIYNLAEKTRDIIYKEWFNGADYAAIQFRAGYKDQFVPLIFNGTVRQAYSSRVGRNNIVTEIEAYDGGFAQSNSFSNFTLSPGALLSDTIIRLNSDLIKTFPTPILGTLPKFVNQRASVFCGPTYSLIQNLLPVGVNATIDNNQLKVLGNNDCFKLNNQIFVISSATGLLDIPMRQGNFIQVKMLFEPRLTIGQQVQLISEDIPIYNNIYPIQGITHEGIISPSVNGPLTTTVNLYLGPNGATTLTGNPVTPE